MLARENLDFILVEPIHHRKNTEAALCEHYLQRTTELANDTAIPLLVNLDKCGAETLPRDSYSNFPVWCRISTL